MEALAQKQRRAGIIAGLAALVAVIVLVLPLVVGMNGNVAAGNMAIPTHSASATPEPSASPTTDPDLAQCRTTALVTYMTEQGFTDGQYVVGEDRIDTTAPEFSRQGSLGFRQDNALPENREELQKVFESDDPNIMIAVESQVQKFPDLDRSVILDSQNWEIVQITVDAFVAGNTGLNDGNLVSVGDTSAKTGDAVWIMIDPETCTVPRAKIDSAGKPVPEGTPLADQPVGALRPGCINGTDGFKPKPPPPVTPPPVTPPPVCPPDMPYGSPPNCKDTPSRGSGPSGNAPDGQGRNDDPTEGVYIPPAEMEQPPSTPRANPPAPAPAPPAPQPPRPSNPNPAPVPTPDPAPAPAPEPPAPAPTNPVSPSDPGGGCIIPPGWSTCDSP